MLVLEENEEEEKGEEEEEEEKGYAKEEVTHIYLKVIFSWYVYIVIPTCINVSVSYDAYSINNVLN